MLTWSHFLLNTLTQTHTHTLTCPYFFPDLVVIQSVFLLMQHERVEEWANSAASTTNTLLCPGPLHTHTHTHTGTHTFPCVCVCVLKASALLTTLLPLDTFKRINSCVHVHSSRGHTHFFHPLLQTSIPLSLVTHISCLLFFTHTFCLRHIWTHTHTQRSWDKYSIVPTCVA